jgi:hypothetical protein
LQTQTETGNDANGEANADVIAGFGTQTVGDQETDTTEPGAGTETSQTGQDEVPATGDDFTLPAEVMGEDGAVDQTKLTAFLKSQHETQAQRIEAQGEVPEGDYDLTIDVDNGAGEKLQIDPENPILKEFLPELKSAGIGQKMVTSLLSKYAEASLKDGEKIATDVRNSVLKQQADQVQAEIKSLGDSAGDRITAVTTKLKSSLGDDAAANTLLNDIRTKAGFEALERLVEQVGGEGGLEGNPQNDANVNLSDADIIFGKGN